MSAKVSLMMPLYNSQRFVGDAITSVLRQTFTAWELVVIDDGSTDDSYAIAKITANGDPRVRFYRNSKNLGITRTRLKAMEYVTGDYIGHIDNDDILERWALEEMLWAFARTPELALAYSDIAQISADGAFELYSVSPTFDADKLHQHGWRHFGMYKRAAYDAVGGFNEKLQQPCEDGDLFMKIAERFKCVRVPKVLYFYRNHGGNTSMTSTKCANCTQRMDCDYMRVWAKSADYDPLTFTPRIHVDIAGAT